MHFPTLTLILTTLSVAASALDPRAAVPQRPPHTSCTSFLSTVTETRTRGQVNTETSTVLILQPTVTTIYQTITSLATYVTTEDERTRTRTRTETVSQCVVGLQSAA
ncbi:hypothetical protein K491DRAFT_694554 [Lophiostoma macrostomum CBS 122681]|uniref:Uncharacterized protein n=1 Tax=Lophiostoma macrostomum CBS 122681 TaxID=1314788 RepID=A0A6A6T2S2_9PLEO|nr:hypothetical protein K491DRAFT_694554 [Lophiostoma macrostomum CBS 122681]